MLNLSVWLKRLNQRKIADATLVLVACCLCLSVYRYVSLYGTEVSDRLWIIAGSRIDAAQRAGDYDIVGI